MRVMQDVIVHIDQGSRYEAIYREHGDHLWRGLVLYTGDPEIASDAVSEAFAQAMRRGTAVDQPMAWVTRAAFRIAAGELKRRGTLDYQIVDAADEPVLPDPALAAALAQLSPKQRAAAILHFRDGYSLKEVATTIGSTPAAVSVHLHRAKARLRDLLGDEDA
jgi:RNA polymerase sigma-70 factor, ECF subfamily